jgi:hypothetical protein
MQQDESGLYGVYEQIAVPFWQTGWFMWSAIFVLFVAAVALFFRWYSRPKKVVSLTPFEKLLLLKGRIASDVATSSDLKLTYSYLMDALKYLFERSTLANLKGLSDQELIVLIREWSQTQNDAAQEELISIINRAQEARFANHSQQKHQILEDLNHIVKLESSIKQSNQKK